MDFGQSEVDAQAVRLEAEQLIPAAANHPAQALSVADKLQRQFDYALARRLLQAACAGGAAAAADADAGHALLARKLVLRLSLCTYKDEHLPPTDRFFLALALLAGLGLRDPACKDTEVLGQGGAIYKRKWECAGAIEDLLTAQAFYQAAWDRNCEDDLGYGALNAAFIHDILSNRACALALKSGTDATVVQTHTAAARLLRLDVLARLPGLLARRAPGMLSYWHAVTLAEAAWGLHRWDEAAAGFERARAAGPSEWELQSTVKQLTATAYFQDVSLAPMSGSAPARAALTAMIGGSADAVLSAHRGKVGLALSGGGFRAALYHLGVLARLAECDALRAVEVLSTVSGGSIVGAHYYLAVRKLLETRTDESIEAHHYVELVQSLIPQFLAGVQRNLRVRTFANVWDNLKMFGRDYTRSNKIGDLYERFLFNSVGEHRPAGTDGKISRRAMNDLKIEPATADSHPGQPPAVGFQPRFSNWRRASKVPVLLINATSLNSGHNWQFTASWMGEPPGLIGDEIDMNRRYRRLYYQEAPTAAMQKFPLAYAVAASAGVPALFAPLPLNSLFPERSVQLVDGGVHDNQGVAGLLDESCQIILCSDASGQMDDQCKPSGSLFGVFFRANSILQARLRETQLQDLTMRVQSRALHGLFYIHMKQELDQPPLGWINCASPDPVPEQDTRTSYKVDRDIQQKLAAIRTDLDSFTDVEAYALMASGYLTTAHRLETLDAMFKRSDPGQCWGGFQIDAARADSPAPAYAWPFAPMLALIGTAASPDNAQREELGAQLAVSRELFGKVWRVHSGLRMGALCGGALCATALALALWRHIGDVWTFAPVFSVSALGVSAGVACALLVAWFPFFKYMRLKNTRASWLLKGAAASLGMLASNIHLRVFDRLFLAWGSLDRLLALPPAPPALHLVPDPDRMCGDGLGAATAATTATTATTASAASAATTAAAEAVHRDGLKEPL